jgi:hypothetical protein
MEGLYLVPHDENVFLPFELHNHGFESEHDISVRFAPCIVITMVLSTIWPFFLTQKCVTYRDIDN